MPIFANLPNDVPMCFKGSRPAAAAVAALQAAGGKDAADVEEESRPAGPNLSGSDPKGSGVLAPLLSARPNVG